MKKLLIPKASLEANVLTGAIITALASVNGLTNGTEYAAFNIDVPVLFTPASAFPSLSSLAVIGDSITYYTAASTPANGWCALVATALGLDSSNTAKFLNQGIGGTVLQNSNGSGGTPLGNNGRDRFVSALLGSNKRDGVFVNYGFNDARYTAAPVTFNVTEYQKDLSQVIAGLIEGGYDRNKILITTPYYITDTGLNTGTTGFTGQTRSGFTAFVDAAKAVAMEYGVWCYDAYAYMLANGAGALISGDNIHPDDYGHPIVATGCLTSTVKLNSLAPVAFTVSRSASTTADYAITAPSGSVTNYTIEYALNGTFDYGNAVTVTALTGSITIPSADCRIRIRANFADTSKSPWAISSKLVDIATFVSDSFTDTDGTLITAHTPEIGGAWVAQSGYAPATQSAINAGRVYSPTTLGTYRNTATPPSADYYVETVIDFLSDIASDAVGVIARANAASNNFYFARFSRGSNNFRMFKQVNGVATQLGTALSASFTSGTYKLKLVCQGDTISMYVNDSLVTSVTDTTFSAAGYAGMMDVAVQTATTGRQITSFKAATV